MVKKIVKKRIDKAIKDIWVTDICKEFSEGRFIVEADIRCSLYYHLRQKLDQLFKENSLYIYSDYYVPGPGRRGQYIDLAICEMDMNLPCLWRDCRTDTAAIIELKYGGGEDWIASDFPKLRGYMDIFGRDCQYYFGVIDLRRKLQRLNWLDKRSTNHWAGGCVTELNAGRLEDGEMHFEVNSYNTLNYSYKRARCDLNW